MLAHYDSLATNGVTVPELLKVMILMSKLPSSMETVVLLTIHGKKTSDLTIASLRDTLLLQYDQRSGHRNAHASGSGSKPALANRITAVKHSPGKPNWQKQQSTAPSGSKDSASSQKPRSRGSRAGKKAAHKGKGKEKQQTAHLASSAYLVDDCFAPEMDVEVDYDAEFPPLFSRTKSYIYDVSKTITLGSHSIQDVRALGNTPIAKPSSTGFFPITYQALTIANRLGIHPTKENVRTLERIVAEANLPSEHYERSTMISWDVPVHVQSNDDSPPLKRRRLGSHSPPPFGATATNIDDEAELDTLTVRLASLVDLPPDHDTYIGPALFSRTPTPVNDESTDGICAEDHPHTDLHVDSDGLDTDTSLSDSVLRLSQEPSADDTEQSILPSEPASWTHYVSDQLLSEHTSIMDYLNDEDFIDGEDDFYLNDRSALSSAFWDATTSAYAANTRVSIAACREQKRFKGLSIL